jgi:hypothetical protein
MVYHFLKFYVWVPFHTSSCGFPTHCCVFVNIERLLPAPLVVPTYVSWLDKVHKYIHISETRKHKFGLGRWGLLFAIGSNLNKLWRLHWIINYNNEQNQHFGVYAQSTLDPKFILTNDSSTESLNKTSWERFASTQTTKKRRSTHQRTMSNVWKERDYWDK